MKKNIKKIITMLLALSFLEKEILACDETILMNDTDTIYTAYTAKEVGLYILSLKVKEIDISHIMFDVDGTLINEVGCATPNFMDNVKKDLKEVSEIVYQNVVGAWRSQRQPLLVDEEWPEVIRNLKTKFTVLALTKMETGKFGPIPLMQEWRRSELKEKGIEFSPHESLSLGEGENAPVCFHGMIMTGKETKSTALEKYHQIRELKGGVVLVDDRIEQLFDVRNFCQKWSLPFVGIHFKGAQKLVVHNDEPIAKLQRHYLVDELKWYPYETLKTEIS